MSAHDKRMQDEATRLGLGTTHRWPLGKLTPDDEGELRCAITVKNGQVVLNFGRPVAWLSLPPQDALTLAGLLIQRCKDIQEETP